MNKKIFMPLVVSTTIAGAIAPAITLTSCSNNYNQIEAVTSTSKLVAKRSAYTSFKFKQSNLKEAEATKVKITNLKIDTAEAKSVAGLIKSTADSGGNIVVRFNMDIAKAQYGTNFESATFDLLFTNKKANTSYTLTGFEVTIDNSGISITYSDDDNVKFSDENITYLDASEIQEVKAICDFTEGYQKDGLSVIIGGVDKTQECTFTEIAEWKWELTIPKSIITGNIDISLTSDIIIFKFDCDIDNFTVSGTPKPAYGQALTISGATDTGYVFNATDFDQGLITVKAGDDTLSRTNGDFSVNTTTNSITIAENVIKGDVSIEGEIGGYDVTINGEPATHISGWPAAQTARKETAFNFSFTSDGEEVTAIVKCGETTLEPGQDKDYTVSTTGLAITETGKSKVLGPMSVDLTALKLSIAGSTNQYLSKANIIDANSTDSNNYVQLTAKNFDDDITKSNDCEWSVVTGSGFVEVDNTKGSDTKGKVTLKANPDFSAGSSAVIQASYKGGAKTFDIEVGSYSNIEYTLNTNDEATCSCNIKTGFNEAKLVIPNRFWDDSSSNEGQWVKATILACNESASLSTLTSLILPDSLVTISANALWPSSSGSHATNLTSIIIPASVQTIGDHAFADSGLTSVTFANANDWYQTGGDEIIVSNPSTNADQLKDGTTTTAWGYTGIEKVSKKSFAETKWSKIIKAVNKFEENETVDTAIELANSFTDTEWSESETKPTDIATALSKFQEKTHTVTLNNIDHTFRIIDVYHDTISSGETYAGAKAAFTFELVQLLSASDGSGLYVTWNSTSGTSSTNYNFPTSTLYNNLNSTSDVTWYSNTSGTVSSVKQTAYSMLLSAGITPKKVSKSVCMTSSYQIKSYDAYCFPLSGWEMCIYTKQEGAKYKYWTTHGSNAQRKKWPVTPSSQYASAYWLTTPLITASTKAWEISLSGSGSQTYTTTKANCSFAFCL